MPFLTANIDRAIVMTQYELRGFVHPLGFRMEAEDGCISPKDLSAVTCNLIVYAAGYKGMDVPLTEEVASYFEGTYEECLASCKKLVADCDLSQKEAIQHIILEILRQNQEMRKRVEVGTMKKNDWLEEPQKESAPWGRSINALMEAFEVPFEQEAVTV